MNEFLNQNIAPISMTILCGLGTYFAFGTKPLGYFLIAIGLIQLVKTKKPEAK